VIQDLRGYLEFEIDEGRGEVSMSREVLGQLGRCGRSAAPTDAVPAPVAQPREMPTPAASAGAVKALEEVAAEIAQCARCELHSGRTNTVPGAGCASPDIMFVGEGPGRDEDLQGLPFVGPAGGLLTRMIKAMGFSREEVFIGNIVKCRPPNNRAPLPDEMATCMPYLKRQIAALKPKVIVALGGTAAKGLLSTDEGITRMRGRWRCFEDIDVMPTFHPAYLLRGGNEKYWDVWEDLCAVLERLGRPIPEQKRKKR